MKRFFLHSVALIFLAAVSLPAQLSTVHFSLDDGFAKRGTVMAYPIRCTDTLSAIDSVYSGEFTLSHNNSIFEVVGIDTTGTMLAGASFVEYSPLTKKIAFARSQPVTGSGVFIFVLIRVYANAAGSTPVTLLNGMLNEGNAWDPSVLVDGGSMRPMDIFIDPKSPPQDRVVGDTIAFSVTGDVTLPVTWSVSDTHVVSVNANGTVIGKNVGQAIITVTDSLGLTDQSEVMPIHPASLRTLNVTVRDTSFMQNLTFDLPIVISEVSSLGIISAQFALHFNSAILQFQGVVSGNTMTQSWGEPAVNVTAGKVTVALAGAAPLNGSGVLTYLRFKVQRYASFNSFLTLSDVLFNEVFNATIDNGTFTPVAGPVITVGGLSDTMIANESAQLTASGGTPPYRWKLISDSTTATIDSITGMLLTKKSGLVNIAAIDADGFDGVDSTWIHDARAVFPDTVVMVTDSIDYPIFISSLNGLSIFSGQLKFSYDTVKLRLMGIRQESSLTNGSTLEFRDSAGNVSIGFSSAAEIAGSGVLMKLRFKATSPLSAGYNQILSASLLFFNEVGPTYRYVTRNAGMLRIRQPQNNPPVFTQKLRDTTIAENQTLNFQLKAFDAEGDSLTFFVLNPPAGMTFTVQGAIAWTPTFAQSGTYKVHYDVGDFHVDGVTRDSAVITVSDANRLPVFTRAFGDTSINEDQILTFDIDGSDPDGDIIRYYIANIQPGMNIDTITGQFNWRPSFSQAGTYNIAQVLNDGKGTMVNKAVAVTVNNVNRPPLFTRTMNDTAVVTGKALNFTYQGSDPDNNTVQFALQSAPAGATISSSGVFTWNPAENQTGNHFIVVRLTDGIATTRDTALVIVASSNLPPLFTKGLPDTTIFSGQRLEFQYLAADPNGTPLLYALKEGPTGASLSPTGLLTWQTAQELSGQFRFIVTISDGLIVVPDTATVVVSQSNRSPVITHALPDTIILENTPLTFTYRAFDADGDTLLWSLNSLPPVGLTLLPNGTLTWTPSFEQSGLYTLIVTVRDPHFTVTDTAVMTVQNVNRPPVFLAVLPDRSLGIDSVLTFAYGATDLDNDKVTFQFLKANGSAQITPQGVFTWKPLPSDLGSDTIIVSASDGTVSVPDTAVINVFGFPLATIPQVQFEFGTLAVGGTKTMAGTVSNTGHIPLVMQRYPVPSISDHFVFDSSAIVTVPVGATHTFSVSYTPLSSGTHQSFFAFTTNDPRMPMAVISVTGLSVAKSTFKKKILLDNAHQNALSLGDSSAGFSSLVTFLAQSGISLVRSDTALHPAGFDGLLLITPFLPYTRAEVERIHRYASDGGMILAIGDGNSASNAVLNALLNDSLINSGLTINTNLVKDTINNLNGEPGAIVLTDFIDKEHPYFINADTLVFFNSASITVKGSAIPFIRTSPSGRGTNIPDSVQPAVVGLSSVGKGKILLFGDVDAWRLDPLSESQHMAGGILAKDNVQFALNVFSVTEDYAVKLPKPTPNERYQLVSIPFDLENSGITAVLKDLGGVNPLVWRLFGRFNPATGRYAEFPSADFNSFRRGEAYWLITRGEFNLNFGDATLVPAQDYFPIRIGPGYSMIGNPFPYKVSWKDSRKGDSIQTIVWKYDGSSFQPESLALEPFAGYFVKNLSSDSITIYINPIDITPVGASKSGFAAQYGDDEWRLSISAASGKARDDFNIAGVSPMARRELDQMDVSEPPATPTDYVVVRFNNTAWERNGGSYAVDIRPIEREGEYWDVDVITAKPQSTVSLSLESFGRLPAEFRIYLIDKRSERAVEIRGSGRYEFTMAKGETKRSFRLMAGKEEFIENNTGGVPLVPHYFALHQNYPNPFNPTTLIQYTLGNSGDVSIAIYNVLGQKVRTLTSEYQAIGSYQVEWDGKDDVGAVVASGVYFYKIIVHANGDKVFTETKKMVLMK